MDYRDKHPTPLTWTREELGMDSRPEPHDQFGASNLAEIDAPDGSATFLYMHAGFSDDGLFRRIAIEAPRNCPMRIAFEWGEISWLDFWCHRGWLLDIYWSIEGGGAVAHYVTPDQLPVEILDSLKWLGFQSPYFLKHVQLELHALYAGRDGEDDAKAEKDYRDFIVKHGAKILKFAA